MNRPWQHSIDDWLERASLHQSAPAELVLPESLRRLLVQVENRSNSNQETRNVMQAIAVWIVRVVVPHFVAHSDDDIMGQLSGIERRGLERVEFATTVYSMLLEAALAYFSLDDTPSHEQGYALSCAAYLVRSGYPVAEDDEKVTQDIRLRQADMLEVVLRLAVVCSVHRNVCGPTISKAAISELTRSLTRRVATR